MVEKLLRHEPSILYEGVKGRSPTRVRQEVASILRVGTEGSLLNLVRRFELGPPLGALVVRFRLASLCSQAKAPRWLSTSARSVGRRLHRANVPSECTSTG